MKIIDFGIKEYKEILNLQETLFEKLIEEKKGGKKGSEYILIGEHPPVITLGRRAKESNVLWPESVLNERGIELFHIKRGGDVTYHCPGQMIVYPILDLEAHKLGVKQYVELLEESVIRLIARYGIKGERIEGCTGVWIKKEPEGDRKICAMGIKCTRFCTMHGLALNITSDLNGFSMINPCGFQDKGVTSLEKEISLIQNDNKTSNEPEFEERISKDISMKKIKEEFLHIFLRLIFPFEEVFNFSEQLGGEHEII